MCVRVNIIGMNATESAFPMSPKIMSSPTSVTSSTQFSNNSDFLSCEMGRGIWKDHIVEYELSETIVNVCRVSRLPLSFR